jgi:L-amino acid N-acyltransferase YncA
LKTLKEHGDINFQGLALVMLSRYLEKSFRTITEEGFYAFIIKCLRNMLYKSFGIAREMIFELNLESFCDKFQPKMELSFQFASEADLHAIQNEIYGYDHKSIKKSMERFHKGDKCLLSFYEDAIVGYVWIMKGCMERSSSQYINLPAHRVYLYNGFVLEEFRGKRVLNSMDTFLIHRFKKEHKRSLVTVVARDNISSIKARERMGFKRVGDITVIGLLGYQYGHIPKKALTYLKT